MRIRAFAVLFAAVTVLGGACVPDGGGGGTTTTTTTAPPADITITYSGPRGNCDAETVVTGGRLRACQGLANATTSLTVSTKVLDPICVDFFAYYDVTSVVGTASQNGGPAQPLVAQLVTPGSPTFDTGFDVDDGPITIELSELEIDVAGGLRCGWFGLQ